MRRGSHGVAATVLLALCGLPVACSAQHPEAERTDAPSSSRALLPPDAARSADAPHVAVGDDACVAAVCASDDSILCLVSPDGGETWRAPVVVGSAGRLEHGLMRGPRVAVTPDALVVAAVCGERLGGHDGDLLAWRSTDRGATWLGPAPITDAPAAAREGLHALAADSAGRLLSVWLDLRNGRTELWGTWSLDGGASWSANACFYRSPEGGICECCPPAAVFLPGSATIAEGGRAAAPSSTAIVLWRNLLAGNRDMFALVVRPAASSPAAPSDAPADPAVAQPLGVGHWALDACPMAGGSAAALPEGAAGAGAGAGGGGGGGVGPMLSFWRRGGELFTARGGEAERRWAEGRETHAASGPGGPHLLWTDSGGRVRSTIWPAAASAAIDWGRGFNAALAGAPDGRGPVLAVWESGAEGPGHLRVALLSPRAPAPESLPTSR